MGKNTKLICLISSFVLLFFAVFLQAYFYDNKSSSLFEEKETFQNKLDTMQSDKETLIKEHKEKEQKLQEEIEQLKKENEALKKENEKYASLNRKTVYLTFDDGPSDNTITILNTLKEKNVKATFFPNGNHSDFAKKTYKRIIDEGHAIGNHTYTHDYSYIYASVDNFKKDFDRLQTLIKDTTGVTPSIYRFPGGSNNNVHKRYGPRGIPVKIAESLKKDGFVFFDWNVDSQDASKVKQSKKVIIDSVLKNTNKKDNIVLFHDSKVKTTTAEALPVIIDELKKRGYHFDTLEKDSFNVQFIYR